MRLDFRELSGALLSSQTFEGLKVRTVELLKVVLEICRNVKIIQTGVDVWLLYRLELFKLIFLLVLLWLLRRWLARALHH